MPENDASTKAPTMIIPKGTEIEVDVHGQLSIRAPGNLVIQNSGHYGTIESFYGSIRIDPGAEVEAVNVRCADSCFVEGCLTAWKVAAKTIHLEENAKANIVLQESSQIEVGREARLTGNFSSEEEMFLLFTRFAQQLRSLPMFLEPGGKPAELAEAGEVGEPVDGRTLADVAEAIAPEEPEPEPVVVDGGNGDEAPPVRPDGDLPDPLFYALILLEREFARSAYGPASQRAIERVIRLLHERDFASLGPTYRTLFGRIVEPGRDVKRAQELLESYFR